MTRLLLFLGSQAALLRVTDLVGFPDLQRFENSSMISVFAHPATNREPEKKEIDQIRPAKP
jgi:hypothetical protein